MEINNHKFKLRVYSDPTDIDSFETVEIEIGVDDGGALYVPFINDEKMQAIWSHSFRGKVFYNVDDRILYYLHSDENDSNKWSRTDHLERIYEVKKLEAEQIEEIQHGES